MKNSIAIKTSHCLTCGMNLAGYSEDAEFCEVHGGQKINRMSAVEKFFHLFEKGGEKMGEIGTKSRPIIGLDKDTEERRKKGVEWAEYLRDNPNIHIPFDQFSRENSQKNN